MPEDDRKEISVRVDAIERLLKMFRMERTVYLIISTISLLMLVGSAGVLIVRESASAEVLILLFGSSGLIAISLGRLLKMWDQAISLLHGKGQ